MQSVLHTLNIGTLATWLSVAGLGTVAVLKPQWHHSAADLAVIEESTLLAEDFTIGDISSVERPGDVSDHSAADISEMSPQKTLPVPPELAPLAEMAPLPEIPVLPLAVSAKPIEARTQSSAPVRQAVRARSAASSSGGTRRQVGNGASSSGSGTGISDSARLAAGRMPAPGYPAESRRKGQTGTVVVEFTVDTSGRVISAYAKSQSPWPLLNQEAVRTVRKWKFPPGGIMKLQRPIVFQLR